MKRYLLLTTLVLLLLSCSKTEKSSSRSTSRTDQLIEKLHNPKSNNVLVVAHRGDWRQAPENSIPAIRSSIKAGVDIVEIDLQMTKDSVLIVMHDATLNRTTTGKGAVNEWTMDSIRTLKLKNGCGIRTKHTVPTLEEALLAAKGEVLINLDKADRYFDKVYEILQKTGTAKQIIMKGSKPADEVLSQYGEYLDEIIYMPVVNLDKSNVNELMDGYITQLNPTAFELVYAEDGTQAPFEMKQLIGDKALIWYNTLWDTLCGGHDDDLAVEDTDAAYGYLIDILGARIIQTDRAEYLLEYLRSRNLHD